MTTLWTITLAPLGPFPPIKLHLSALDEADARVRAAKLHSNREFLSVKKYGDERKAPVDASARADEIKAAYLDSGREQPDEDKAVLRLMDEAGELFEDNEAARDFLTEDPTASRNPNENCLAGFECPACGSYGPFRIRGTVSGETLVTDDGTEGIEGDVEWEDHSGCRCADCGRSGSVREFHGKPDPAFSPFQAVAASVYDEGEHLCGAAKDIDFCGDSLLIFIMKELAESEGCDSVEEAVSRMNVAIRQIEQVRDALETTWSAAEQGGSRQQDAQFAH